jgi:hypothetical protein
MNFENIFREVLEEMKKRWELPTSGFLCGGSLANLIWEKISGNKAIVNDIDIFIYKGKPESEDFVFTNFNVNKTKRVAFESYQGLRLSYNKTVSHVILNSIRDGDFNYIDIYSLENDPQSIIDSFDINCCQVGYVIDEGKFIYTKEFIHFLETGELKLINLHTPAHSSIRLVKKADELGVEIPKDEIKIAATALTGLFLNDIQRVRFKDKYHDLYKKYESHLQEFFNLTECGSVDIFNDGSLRDKLYRLEPKDSKLKKYSWGIGSSEYFLAWMRQVKDNSKLEEMWSRLVSAYDAKMNFQEYLDIELDEKDLNLITRVIKWSPKSLDNLIGKTLSKQIGLIKKVFEHFKEKPLVGISFLETIKDIDKLDFEDEMLMMVLELSLRKVNDIDRFRKVEKIFDNNPSHITDTDWVVINDVDDNCL